MSAYEKLLEHILTLDIIDTHEHLPNEAEWAASDTDVLSEWLLHYFSSDLVSAGLPQAVLNDTVRDSSKPLLERWKTVRPYWEAARNTGYARALDIAARDLYGVDRFDGKTIEAVNEEFLKRRSEAASGKKSYYRHVLKDKSRISVSLTDFLSKADEPADTEFFRSVYRIEGVIDLSLPAQFETLSAKVGIPIHSLDDYAEAVSAAVDLAFARGAVALKCPLAYSRPIRFLKRTRAEAESIFNSLLAVPSRDDVGAVTVPPSQPLTDYMMHCVLALADRRGLTMQVHTGLQEGNGNVLANSNPELLTNLFLEYKNVTFDIFHISYPWWHVLAAQAKNFPNVMIDMCWAHIISPEASVCALSEFLDSVPANKISAFGGDYLFPDGVYGHQLMARQNVARTLSLKVDNGVFDLERAAEIATWLFVDNPRRIFNLDV